MPRWVSSSLPSCSICRGAMLVWFNQINALPHDMCDRRHCFSVLVSLAIARCIAMTCLDLGVGKAFKIGESRLTFCKLLQRVQSPESTHAVRPGCRPQLRQINAHYWQRIPRWSAGAAFLIFRIARRPKTDHSTDGARFRTSHIPSCPDDSGCAQGAKPCSRFVAVRLKVETH
jgi:hypothetical protein